MAPSELNKYSNDDLLCVAVKCFDISEELIASIFNVTGLIELDATVIWRKKCVGYIGWVFYKSQLQKAASMMYSGKIHCPIL